MFSTHVGIFFILVTKWAASAAQEGFRMICSRDLMLAKKSSGQKSFNKKFLRGADASPIRGQIREISKISNQGTGKFPIPPYRKTVLTLFNTGRPMKFRFDKKDINFLYMNGVIEPEVIPGDASYVRFASPFVQKRLFNYFSVEIFSEMGELVDSLPGIFF